jgi:hypothetical protein
MFFCAETAAHSALPRKADSAHRAAAKMHGDLTASLILFAAAQRENLQAQHFQGLCASLRAAESHRVRFGSLSGQIGYDEELLCSGP